VLGLGRIGSLHAQHLANNVPGACLVRVADSRCDVAEQAGASFDVEWSSATDEVLEDRRVRAVVIATPTATHAGLVERAAAAGKHVLCEKPLALDVETTASCVAAASTAGVTLQVGFHLRYDPDLTVLQRNLIAGDLGDVLLFTARLRDMSVPPAAYLRDCGGLLLDGGVHLFDLARWMVGEIAAVSAVGAPAPFASEAQDDPNTTVVTSRFRCGALGVIENCRSAGYGFDCAVEVLGTRRTARISDGRISAVTWLDPGKLTAGHVGDFVERFAAAYLAELSDFAAAVCDERAPRATGEDALAAAILADAARGSLLSATTVGVDPGVAKRVVCSRADEATTRDHFCVGEA
jgi:myo-inositol 2-dehydrogenase/D-chiro-inositol 1-dehydrogenase